ncbi:hypothetical protein [Motiliproteus sp. MSK22-1]|uniref:hypothetical protein n=1 Tax=Motiliproteus sp. MSK22-1 TaxID=1897630 RepID=UPI000975EEA7|nr:hypothetical protein [Motiliproteus sp. MSK22-1]OMH39094.1 hypothetical protein BGP75_05150 [Motiliproteus sp. MSK22-1]
MHIPTYVLAIKGSQGRLRIAEGRRKDVDLPISFDEKYANFLFEFSESRIFCKENDEIMLLKGSFDISDIKRNHRFVETFKRRVREVEDLTGWNVLKTKAATTEKSLVCRQHISEHFMRKQSAFQRLQRITPDTQEYLPKRVPAYSIGAGVDGDRTRQSF